MSLKNTATLGVLDRQAIRSLLVASGVLFATLSNQSFAAPITYDLSNLTYWVESEPSFRVPGVTYNVDSNGDFGFSPFPSVLPNGTAIFNDYVGNLGAGTHVFDGAFGLSCIAANCSGDSGDSVYFTLAAGYVISEISASFQANSTVGSRGNFGISLRAGAEGPSISISPGDADSFVNESLLTLTDPVFAIEDGAYRVSAFHDLVGFDSDSNIWSIAFNVVNTNSVDPTPVPAPTPFALIAVGLLGLWGTRSRRKKH